MSPTHARITAVDPYDSYDSYHTSDTRFPAHGTRGPLPCPEAR
ncbi:hypothetical protein ACWEQ7_24250 [Streptomyces sp. NPDC004069]